MTRRRVIFYNDLNNTWIVSEQFNGDKTELEQRKSADYCDGNWADFMEAMNGVNNLVDFLDVLTMIWKSYHFSLPEEGRLPGTRLSIAHNLRELQAMTDILDEVWEVSAAHGGAVLLSRITDAG